MNQDRPYRKALPLEEIIEIIKKDSGKKWNKEVVEEFVGILHELIR